MATAEMDVEQASRILQGAGFEELQAQAIGEVVVRLQMAGHTRILDDLSRVDQSTEAIGAELQKYATKADLSGLAVRMEALEGRMGRLETQTNDLITSVRVLENTVQLSLSYMKWVMGGLLVLLIALLGLFGTLAVRLLFYP